MKKSTKINLIVSVITLLFVSAFFSNSLTVMAFDTGDVYKAAPEGVALNDYMDYTAQFTTNKDSMKNQATIYKANSATYNNPYDIIQMMNGTDKTQLSSIWGTRSYDSDSANPKIDNYFDLKNKQSVSAWLYFGDRDPYKGVDYNSSDTAKNLPDGLAFVLQNDSRGKNAISYGANDGKLAYGQTLGVWGSGNSDASVNSSVLSIGSGAIKNSFALEFDNLRNSTVSTESNSKDDYFDGMKKQNSDITKGQHMAWGYPGASTIEASTVGSIPTNFDASQNTYLSNKYRPLFSISSYYYYGMNHQGVLPGLYFSGDSQLNKVWHHFTLNYTPPESGSTMATVQYIFNDKNYDGTPTEFNEWDKNTVKIDISKLMTLDIGSSNPDPYKVRWGFTASTGSQYSAPSPFAIVIQEMPNVANIEVSTKLFDLSEYNAADNTWEREISDLDRKGSNESSNNPKYNVANGDKLRFEYDLNYISGFAGTGDEIATTLNLPDAVDFSADPETDLGKDDIIGQIKYANFAADEDNQTVPIYASEVSTDSDGNQVLHLNLHKMDTANQTAKIELFGKAQAKTTPTTVKGEHANYKSIHFIDDALSPSFIINDPLQLSTKDDLNLGTINTKNLNNNQVNLNLTADYKNGSKFDKNNFTLYTEIDGQQLNSTVVSTTDQQTTYDIANNIGNSTQLTAEYLGVGEHTIKVWAVDYLNRTSTPITYNVVVQGTQLSLDIDPEYFFQDINSQSSKGYVNRKGVWKVKVNSTDTPWTLTASADPLTLKTDSTQELGPLFYRDKSGNDQSLVDQSPIIASDNNADPTTKVTDIGGNWGTEDGILLESIGVKQAGEYGSVINWNLINSL